MSLFGYPATAQHYHPGVDEWGRPLSAEPVEKAAKVVEEQRLIRNAQGEEITVAYTVFLEGVNAVGFDDWLIYTNAIGTEVRIDVRHYEIRKYLGTDEVKEVVIYG
ncbi:hypothetical protein J2Z22_001589 [Paenibacillus forsythiae]|uniref:YolD-like family protein n=1 Tax=Paenibacillus forsythiae TaxID=365616 RepID=A0ABU3H5G3_9BACL|nr:hypothetical protein [Paenibacillus forsythiae]MDT3426069.1 hypothetical protein [Paenibacillus forsythiae]